MRAKAIKRARSVLGRAVHPWVVVPPSWIRIISDPYLFYTASLVPIVWIVASTTAAGDFWTATVLGITALGAQLLLGYIGERRHIKARVGWQLLRLLPPLVFVSIASRTVGGSSLPLIPLFIPVVAGAAAAGKVQGAVAASVAAAVMLVPELASFSSPSGIGLRGMTLAGVTIVVAFGTHRIVRALEEALTAARTAVVRPGIVHSRSQRSSRSVDSLPPEAPPLSRSRRWWTSWCGDSATPTSPSTWVTPSGFT